MKTLNFVIIKLTFFLILGISFAHSIRSSLLQTFYTCIGLMFVLGITLYLENQKLTKRIWFGTIAYIAMILLGILTYQTHHHKNFELHYSKVENVVLTDSNFLIFKVKERLKPTKYYNKYVVELLNLNDHSVKGNLLLNVKQIENAKPFTVDEVLLTQSVLESVNAPLNPNQFNYKAYLEKQYIYHQLFSKEQLLLELSSERQTIFGYADALRQKINKELRYFNFKPEELAVINALILGQRQDMDQEMYASYAKAGAIHILAVSGLHVGIILMILNLLLRPLETFKRGNVYKIISILILLWSFAIVAGLSASVTRAVTMFSILTVAMHLKRPTNIYNTLSISIFILLLVKPMFLFDVGFQMSYLAVFAIVSLQPLISQLWRPKWYITNYVWQIFTVTIAAQLGVLPISLYYFHQFPGLFFVSNLIIIPFLGLILGFGIIVILFSLLQVLPETLANMYGMLISSMNRVVIWVSDQDIFILKEVSFDISFVVTSYILLIASILAYRKFQFKQIAFLLTSIILIQSVSIYAKFKNSTDTFVVFHKNRYSMIGMKEGNVLTVSHNLDHDVLENDKTISNYKVGNSIHTIIFDSLGNIYKTPNKTMLVIDSLSVYNVSFKTNYILLRNSPRINLKRMIDSLQPEYLIVDGSNYKSYAERWRKTCLKEKIPFHYTYEKGAFMIK